MKNILLVFHEKAIVSRYAEATIYIELVFQYSTILRFIPEERFSEEQNTDQKPFSSLRKGFPAKETQQQSQTWKKEKLKLSAKARIQCSDAEA